MRLTIVHVRECPNVAILHGRLAEVVAGRGDIELDRRLVDSEREAGERGMTGSPTLLVDGRDPFAEPGRSTSQSCRLYRDEPGNLTGAPSVAQLRQALEQTATLEVAVAVADEEGTGVERDCCRSDEAWGGSASARLASRRARTTLHDPAVGPCIRPSCGRSSARVAHLRPMTSIASPRSMA
jgi:hypothetical protein